MRSSVASPEVPCVRCGQRVAGLAWGTDCPECARQLKRRASRVAGRISLLATLLVGVYIWLRMPRDPSFRVYAGITVGITYLLVRQIASRVALEVFAREPRKEVGNEIR